LVGAASVNGSRVIPSAVRGRPVGRRVKVGRGVPLTVGASVGTPVERARDHRQVAGVQNRQRWIVEVGAQRIGVGGAGWREAGTGPHQRQQQRTTLPVNEPDVGAWPARSP
jgi:hypothetical protein